jgi:hypothetical protein
MSRLTQLRAWWHRWREEFYEDNPISWLVSNPYRAFYTALSKERLHQLAQEIARRQGEAEGTKLTAEALTRLREQAPALPLSWLPPVWTVSKSECWWLIALWSIPLIMAGIVLQQDWHTLMRSFSTLVPFYLLALSVYLYLSIIFSAFLFVIPHVFLRETLSPEGTLYIGLTRLESRHVVYGILSHTIVRGMRRLVFYILPWLFLFGIFLYGTLGAALWFAIITLFYLVGLAWFSHSANLAFADRQMMRMRSIISIYILFKFIVIILLFGVLIRLARIGIGGTVLPSVWEWFFMPLFWISLIPPMFLVLAPLVQFHPFWGIPQVLVLVGLSWWMTRRAIVHLRVFRRLREQPTTTSSDEDWE